MSPHRALVFVAALLALSGCATIRRHEAGSTEELLVAAGFQMRHADNPERVHDIGVMPPLKLVARNQAGDDTGGIRLRHPDLDAEADGEASLFAFLVELDVELVPVPDFLVVVVDEVFLVEAALVVEVASCSCVHATKNAVKALTVINPSTSFFIGYS